MSTTRKKNLSSPERFCNLGVQAKARHLKFKLIDMKPVFLFIVCIALSTACFSQTKRIAYRSHSGSNASFTLAGEGNFGLPSEEAMKRMEAERKRREAENKRIRDSIAKAEKKAGKNKMKNKKPAQDTLQKPVIDTLQTIPARTGVSLIMLLELSKSFAKIIRIIPFAG